MVFKRRDEKRETLRNRERIMSGKINGHGNINKKITAALLCVSLFFLTGCGNGQAEEVQKGTESTENSGGMGRYVEEILELPEEINRNGGLNMLSDGSMTIISFNSGLWRSINGGVSWQKEETEFFPMMQNVYALSAVMAPDGTVAVTCSGEMPEAAKQALADPLPEDWAGNYCIFVSPEGGVKVVDFGFTQEDGSCLATLQFQEDGRLFGGDMNGKIYEIDIEHESLKELFMMERKVGSIGFNGNTLMAVGTDGLYLYDLEKGELLPRDTVADQFIKNALTEESVSYTGGGYPLVVFGGEDAVIYIACVDGLYRHAPGGSTVEQVIDGALSSLGDHNTIYLGRELSRDMAEGSEKDGSGEKESAGASEDAAGREFLVQFGRMLARYRFDASMPAMPDKELRIYSLEDQSSVRKAATIWKKEHTDMYVRYEVGMDGEDGVTKEDAIRKLNTRILAGDGPDVIILDGLPVDSYIEKGMLADISGLLESTDGEEALFANLVESFREENGAVYGMPLCIQVPLLAGDTNVINRIEDLESFADEMEALRQEYPEGCLLGICDEETMLRLFGMVSSPAWTDESGEIDGAAVTEFLTQVKRIYDAERAGASAADLEVLQREDEELREYGMDVVENNIQICNNVLNIRRGYARLACGYVNGIQLCLDNVTSVIRLEEAMHYKSFPGQEKNVFVPKTMVGLNVRSEQRADAEAFIRMMFSGEAQENMYDGFPVNREAFAGWFAMLQGGDSNGSMLLPKKDGTEEELELLWPDAGEERVFTELVQNLDTPVEEKAWLDSLVCELGTEVLEEQRSVEDAVAEIEKRAAIYLAE